MKYVEIKGGLGNQIFQYCFSKYLEQKYGSDIVLHPDFFDYVKKVPQATVRQFDLDKMQTNYISVKGNIICRGIVEEELFDDHVDNHTTEFYSGYWQDKKYFEYVKDKVCSDFCLKDRFITDDMRKIVCKMEESNSVSLHIRRTDYLTGLNIDIFSALDTAYYKKAIDIVWESAGHDAKVFAFSDDPGYASKFMELLHISAFEIMPVREAFQDIYLMSGTKHHIIANSSFGWWAAALSYGREKRDYDCSCRMVQGKAFSKSVSGWLEYRVEHSRRESLTDMVENLCRSVIHPHDRNFNRISTRRF